MTAIVNGLELILLSRILTGMGESPAFPGSFKATGYWFLVRERGRATTFLSSVHTENHRVSYKLLVGGVIARGFPVLRCVLCA